MLVYKYRDGNDSKMNGFNQSTLDRDLISINSNYFWSAQYRTLNDPCETLIDITNMENQVNSLNILFPKNRRANAFKNLKNVFNEHIKLIIKNLGVFSLSKTYLDELLWAHYANSHYGFCIEYDLDKLLSERCPGNKLDSFDVKYPKKPPKLNSGNLADDNSKIIKILCGCKSKRWIYERELRIVSDFYGEVYYDPDAINGIYFGLRMKDSVKEKILKSLKDRNIKFYEIRQVDKSYKFERKEIINPFKTEFKYLKEIPKSITGTESNNFKIMEKKYFTIYSKGKVRIMLDRKPTKLELEWISNFLKVNLFLKCNEVYMYYMYENQESKDVNYATSHFNEEKGFQIKVNESVV